MPAAHQHAAYRQLVSLLAALNARWWPAWTVEGGPTLVDGRSVVRLKVDYCLRGRMLPPQVVEVRLPDGPVTAAMVDAVHAAGIPTWARDGT